MDTSSGTSLRPRAGQILDLQAEDVRYRAAPLLFQVDVVRGDIPRGYDDQSLWLEGHELHPTGRYPMTWLQILVSVKAIARNADLTASEQPTRYTGRAQFPRSSAHWAAPARLRRVDP